MTFSSQKRLMTIISIHFYLLSSLSLSLNRNLIFPFEPNCIISFASELRHLQLQWIAIIRPTFMHVNWVSLLNNVRRMHTEIKQILKGSFYNSLSQSKERKTLKTCEIDDGNWRKKLFKYKLLNSRRRWRRLAINCLMCISPTFPWECN
jgi:hypothetical protein